MAIQNPKRLISIDDYHRMAADGLFSEDDRVELIEGEIVEMTPVGDWHCGSVRRYVLTDFEEGVPDAAEDITVEELARLAAACCASLDEVVTPEAHQEARRKERKRKQARSGGLGFDFWL